MNKIITILTVFFVFFFQASANVGVAQISSYGSMKISKNSLILKYIAVEKELLTFELKQGNILGNSDEKYIGMDYFLEKYKNNTKILNYIKNNTLGEKNIPFYLQEKTPIKFYNVPSVGSKTEYFEVTAKYFLKNTGDKDLKNQKVFFSDFQPKFLNGAHFAEEVYDMSFLDYLVLLYEDNNFAQDVEVTFDNKKIDISKSVVFQKANSSILNTTLPPKNIIYPKEVSAFELNFSPNQNHILEVKYKIPAVTFYNTEASLWYDFSPIFSWKGGTVKDVEVQIFGAENHDLNKEFTTFANDFVKNGNMFVLKKQNVTSKSGMNTFQLQLLKKENKK